MKLTSSGLAWEDGALPPFLPGFADAVLRGIGQVMLQNNSYAGLLFLAGIFYNSRLFGLAALAGTIVSTATARLLGADRASVRAGLFGFNGALVAIALLYFLQPDALAWAFVVLASACSTVLMGAMMRLMS
ncbi:MAG TPA: urea transporter, partial [Holophagaceae bacterium]|nr:urea transporter [Holophagaceae bacterium]